MVCKKCGSQLSPGAAFCPNCGTKVDMLNTNTNTNTNDRQMLAIVISLSALLVIALAVIVFLVFIPHSDPAPQPTATATVAPTDQPTDTVTAAATIPAQPPAAPAPVQQAPVQQAPVQQAPVQQAPQQPVSDGYYNPSLTYKRMPEIHQSVSAGAGMINWAQSLIENFDSECEAYMNGYGGIPSSLLSGSTAYNQQTSYKQKHPSLVQYYTLVDAQNVREYGNYYYIWVHEIIDQSEKGVNKTDNSHWVYKVTASGMIVDYTADPAYK